MKLNVHFQNVLISLCLITVSCTQLGKENSDVSDDEDSKSNVSSSEAPGFPVPSDQAPGFPVSSDQAPGFPVPSDEAPGFPIPSEEAPGFPVPNQGSGISPNNLASDLPKPRPEISPGFPMPDNGSGQKLPNGLWTNQILTSGQTLTSENRRYFAILHTDGNFAVYHGSSLEDNHGLLWSTGTGRQSPGSFFMIPQEDGNLCLYRGVKPSSKEAVLWCSNTSGRSANVAYLSNDGSFKLGMTTIGSQEIVWNSPQDEHTCLGNPIVNNPKSSFSSPTYFINTSKDLNMRIKIMDSLYTHRVSIEQTVCWNSQFAFSPIQLKEARVFADIFEIELLTRIGDVACKVRHFRHANGEVLERYYTFQVYDDGSCAVFPTPNSGVLSSVGGI